jgi:hypothetical protein
MTGAEGALDLVKTQATLVFSSIVIRLKSSLSLYLIPECIADNLNPLIFGKLGNASGAKGDFLNFFAKSNIFLFIIL